MRREEKVMTGRKSIVNRAGGGRDKATPRESDRIEREEEEEIMRIERPEEE